MKISTKGRYALRVMLDLALNYEGESISLRDVAERENISVKYLEQLMSTLTKAGFVISKRGASGGYSLSKPPEEYTVGDIIKLMEGSLAPAPCVETGHINCPDSNDCIYGDIWYDIMQAVYDVIDNITLADMVDKYKARKAGTVTCS